MGGDSNWPNKDQGLDAYYPYFLTNIELYYNFGIYAMKPITTYYPTPPLAQISPSTGNIELSWGDVSNGDIVYTYDIYRDSNLITDVSELTPIETGLTSFSYTDIVTQWGTYYYVITVTDENGIHLSNCESVEVTL